MSRTIRIKLFKFEELSDKAKQVALDEQRYTDTTDAWGTENVESMEKFAEIFPIKVTNWSYGGRGEGVDFRFDGSDIEELSGQRLATYLWNNYRDEIYSKKWYNLKTLGITDEWFKHSRITSRKIEKGPNAGKWRNSYHSALTLETYNCPLTGYCMDNELLDEIWKFIDKPDRRNFKDLLENCFEAWIKACNADREYQESDEYIKEGFEANGAEFTSDGKRY